MGLALVWLVFLLCNSFPIIYPLSDEGFALLSFKHSIKEDPEGSLTNWNSSDENPCSWNGITCRESKVVSLTIPKKKLVGFLPSVLGSLSSLRRINLRNNKLFGSLPVELFNAQSLQSLVLYGNFLSGSLPPEIGNLRYLQTLDLSHNLLNGSIPKSLIQCKRLKTLVLNQNSFTGFLPDGLGSSLVALEKIDFSFNQLSGSIPFDMGNLLSLQEMMDLSHNLFSGPIPESLGNIPERVYIDLTYNNLSGPIPQNGDLRNRGVSTFVGNPGLCGPPLKNPCPLTRNYTDRKSGGTRDLSKNAVIAIVASDVVGIFLIGLLLSYCFVRVCSSREGKDDDGSVKFEKGTKRSKDCCLCFRKNDGSAIQSNNVDQYDLVALDKQVDFDLDELLKASAFVLGKSGNGIVYRVVLEDGFTLAVRRLGEGGSQRFKEFQTEVEAISRIRHANIVKLRAYYWSVDEKLLIYNYVPNGNLATAIHGNAGILSFTPLSWSVRLRIMEGIAKGLAYLHEFRLEEYVHGDLKPKSILLGQNMEPQIADFGVERLTSMVSGYPKLQPNRKDSEKERQWDKTTSQYVRGSSTMTSRSYYQAPETLKVIKPSQKCDVYSYGVILLEIISGKLPIVQVGTSEMDLVLWVKLCIEENKPLTDVLDPFLVQEAVEEEEEMVTVLKIALACVQTSPERRPSMRNVVDIFDRLTATYG